MDSRDEVIEIVEYDPGWPARFRSERDLIVASLGPAALDVQHIGSTAVPGLSSKPVIDIMVAVASLSDRTGFEPGLVLLGYVNVPHDEDGVRLFFRKGMPRTHHVHVVRHRSWAYWMHLLFRDYLMNHPSAMEEYECLKLVLAQRFRDDREKYLEGKADFIGMAVRRAVRERTSFFDPSIIAR